ncbi:hypothetical protein ACP4OV_002752 [Aristida adscensionis]
MSRRRRYVYVVVNNFSLSSFPLRCIEASTLFVSNNQMKATRELEEGRLPRPDISFIPRPKGHGNGRLEFLMPFGRGKNKSLIAATDEEGFTSLYDVIKRAVLRPVVLNRPTPFYSPISLAVGDELYAMDKEPSPCAEGGFDVLRFPSSRGAFPVEGDWTWHSLPPPSYVLAPGYRPHGGIDAYTPGIGTYAFDTRSGRGLWSKAGHWELPFRGRADYLPEYGVWLGFSPRTNMLCAANLLDASMERGPRLLHDDWVDLCAPEDWILNESHLVDLGGGRLCVAKFFRTEHEETALNGEIYTEVDDKFAVFTGLKLERLGGELRMIKHRSVRYRFESMTQSWVF